MSLKDKGKRKAYQKKYHKIWYLNNKDLRRKQINDRRKRIVEENRKNLYNYFSDKSCIDCSEDDFIVLEFDHLSDKEYSISKMLGDGLSWRKILFEISKCEVVCANCHRKRTAKRGGFWRTNIE